MGRNPPKIDLITFAHTARNSVANLHEQTQLFSALLDLFFCVGVSFPADGAFFARFVWKNVYFVMVRVEICEATERCIDLRRDKSCVARPLTLHNISSLMLTGIQRIRPARCLSLSLR
jgi:hypothetical protein